MHDTPFSRFIRPEQNIIYILEEYMRQSVYDVVIIGGGPAGLTAAIYTSRALLKTVLIASTSIAGQATRAGNIENYPGFSEGISGFDLVSRFRKHAEDAGTGFISSDVTAVKRVKFKDEAVWEITDSSEVYLSRSLIIASGARPRQLDVKGENEFLGKGVSYCAVCDGAFFKNKKIVVVGGGNSAVEEALFLTRFASKVTLIHRRSTLRADRMYQERAKADKKIDFRMKSVVREITGETKVQAVKLLNLDTNEEHMLECEGVFISAGLVPNTAFIKDNVKLDENGYVKVDMDMKTSQVGIFACGDCRKTSLRQVVSACADGAMAGYSAQKYVEEMKGIQYR